MDTWKRSGGLLTGDISLSAVTCGQGEESSFEMSCIVDSVLFRWGFLKNLLLSSFLLCTSVKKLFCFICSRVRISHLRQDKLDEGYLIERTNKKKLIKTDRTNILSHLSDAVNENNGRRPVWQKNKHVDCHQSRIGEVVLLWRRDKIISIDLLFGTSCSLRIKRSSLSMFPKL